MARLEAEKQEVEARHVAASAKVESVKGELDELRQAHEEAKAAVLSQTAEREQVSVCACVHALYISLSVCTPPPVCVCRHRCLCFVSVSECHCALLSF